MLYSSVFCARIISFLTVTTITLAQSNPSCQSNWAFFPKASKCFRLFGAGGSDALPKMTWADAERHCNSLRGHLASIGSEEENQFIVDLIKASFYDDGFKTTVFIGLSYNSVTGWTHADGSTMNYLKWYFPYVQAGSMDGRYPTGSIMTRGMYTGYMDVWSATQVFPFVCQVSAVTEG